MRKKKKRDEKEKVSEPMGALKREEKVSPKINGGKINSYNVCLGLS
jgi:hypothetical protein